MPLCLKVWHYELSLSTKYRPHSKAEQSISHTCGDENEKEPFEIHNFICGLSFMRVFYDFRLMIYAIVWTWTGIGTRNAIHSQQTKLIFVDAKRAIFQEERKTIVTAHKMKMMWVCDSPFWMWNNEFDICALPKNDFVRKDVPFRMPILHCYSGT